MAAGGVGANAGANGIAGTAAVTECRSLALAQPTLEVSDAELALVTGGPASLPVSGLILGRAA